MIFLVNGFVVLRFLIVIGVLKLMFRNVWILYVVKVFVICFILFKYGLVINYLVFFWILILLIEIVFILMEVKRCVYFFNVLWFFWNWLFEKKIDFFVYFCLIVLLKLF